MKTIIHVDMDAFYASVEVLDRPELAGRPVIVGADPKGGAGRGVVSAASYEARKSGVHSAMPVSRAIKLCPEGVFLPPRMKRYIEISARVFEIFNRYTDLVEGLSLDEAFLDVTGSLALFGPGPEIGRRIKEDIKREIGLVCSVGIAPTKFVAKIASDLEKPDGFVVVEETSVREFLNPLPLTRLWGVGPKTAEILNKRGLRTIGDVSRLTPADAAAIMGEHGLHIRELSLGIDPREVEPGQKAKSIGNETTFDTDTSDRDLLTRTLLALADNVAGRLRKQGLTAGGLSLKFRDEDFTTLTRAMKLETPTNITRDIYQAALSLLQRTGWNGVKKVRLIGVTAEKLLKGEPAPNDLFTDRTEIEKQKKAEKAVDELRERFGKKAVGRGALYRK